MLRHLLSGLLKALPMAAALAGVACPASATPISNTASASWGAKGRAQSSVSNTVVFERVEMPMKIDTFRVSPNASLKMKIPAMSCGTAPAAAGSPSPTSERSVVWTKSFQVGQPIVFQLTIPLANVSAATVDAITVRLTASDGDVEMQTLQESGANTGVFIGSIATSASSSGAESGDCRLAVRPGGTVKVAALDHAGVAAVVELQVDMLADPFGTVFDSASGEAVSGARVTLIDAATGRPAEVFADDGVTTWPSSMISGQPITDGEGTTHAFEEGEYRFPLVATGSYRLQVEPPSPYTAPSRATPAEIAQLKRAEGGPFVISPASFGNLITLTDATAAQVDIPIDAPEQALVVSKTASKQRVQPGDALFYSLTVTNPVGGRNSRKVTLVDLPASTLRLTPDSVRVDGQPAAGAVTFSPDGRRMTLELGSVTGGRTVKVTYAATVRPDAPAGIAENRVEATDDRAATVKTSAAVRIDRELIAGRMTLVGRISAGACGGADGVAGVRVILEDGSFALTDRDGRYHFEGLVPGTHVVQVAQQTLPQGAVLRDCAGGPRSAGSADSRFVTGQGGTLAVADFAVTLPAAGATTGPDAQAANRSDREAAGADQDWLALGAGPTDWLFPALDYNPRAPATRVVIRHAPGEKVTLSVNGKEADPLAFDGATTAPGGGYAVSIWRGLPLVEGRNSLHATIHGADTKVTADLTRDVFFTSTPAQAQLLADKSHLVADGTTSPTIAVRIVDRHGRPVRAGLTGQVQINAPYESARALAAMQLQQLTGTANQSPTWAIEGDDGVALIELAPTMVSGPLHLTFTFTDGEQSYEQKMDAWIVPGDQKWTLVGLAEGSIGSRSIADEMQVGSDFDSDLGEHARVAFYAKGRVLGRFLLTASYDSAKQEADQRLLGTIDPNAYYTVFADGSDRRFDAASREKLYVRVESRTFYALYGDFTTGFEETDLARYSRTLTGAKAEGQFGGLHVEGFAAEATTRHWRDELQGSGLSGPYALSSRAIVPNSEHVAIEVRDRFRSEIVVSRQELTRFIDYDIDLLSGTLNFRSPVLSRDFSLNPQIIVVDYEIETDRASGELNGGLRADYTFAGGAVRIGATALSDNDGSQRTDLAALDLKARLGDATELRAEVAGSRRAGADSTAWQVEAEHHDGRLDVLAYAREIEADFGVGQESAAERGRRKIGADVRLAATDKLSMTASVWQDQSLEDITRRRAVELRGVYRTPNTDLLAGISRFDDRLPDGHEATSTVLEAAVAQRLMDRRLELEASTSVGLDATESIDLPTRHALAARFALTPSVRLVGKYEIAEGDAISARTLTGGVEVAPWSGARVVSTLGQSDIAEYGKRSFAAFGLSQTISLTPSLSLDATIDGNRTIGSPASDPLNPLHPVASGGQLGANGDPYEEFSAATLGAAWRKDLWSVTLRGEIRNATSADRRGLTFGAIRQLGDGTVVGSGFTWTEATTENGASTQIFDGAIAAAFRPANSRFNALGKLEYRSDDIRDGVSGEAAGAGRTALTVDGDATSRRLIASLSTNWHSGNELNGGQHRVEMELFVGSRYSFDRYDDFDLAGFTGLLGADARFKLSERVELGATATVRSSLSGGETVYAVGPQVGFSPSDGVLLTVGYNVSGFHDDDFAAARSTREGFYAGVKMKFDAGLLSTLGLRR